VLREEEEPAADTDNGGVGEAPDPSDAEADDDSGDDTESG
jgi:hypothetical protein